MDPDNQEAKLVQMSNAYNNNRLNNLNSFRLDSSRNKNELLEFLFYQNDKVKNKSSVSNSFLDIVRSSYANRDVNYSQNYNFLLFYASLSILINSQNFEAIFIKGQLLQLIDDFVFAEKTYLTIPENSEYFIDAQRNIAFNYSRESVFTDAENKILKIVIKNNSDNELKKILPIFTESKKYNAAINLYTEL